MLVTMWIQESLGRLVLMGFRTSAPQHGLMSKRHQGPRVPKTEGFQHQNRGCNYLQAIGQKAKTSIQKQSESLSLPLLSSSSAPRSPSHIYTDPRPECVCIADFTWLLFYMSLFD